MDKRTAHHAWRRIRKVSPLYLTVATVLCAIGAGLSLRQNNLRALELRDKVLLVDKENGDTAKALNELRTYIYSHMNANLATDTSVYPPIQLKYRYDRLMAKEKKRASDANEKIYSDAQAFCERQNPSDFSGRNRIPCIEDYVTSHGIKEKAIPDSLYKFDFASPVWSPDLAGWLVVATGLLALLTIIRLLAGLIAKQLL